MPSPSCPRPSICRHPGTLAAGTCTFPLSKREDAAPCVLRRGTCEPWLSHSLTLASFFSHLSQTIYSTALFTTLGALQQNDNELACASSGARAQLSLAIHTQGGFL